MTAALIITRAQTALSRKILSTLNTKLPFGKMIAVIEDSLCNRNLDLPAADPEDFYKKMKFAANFVSTATTPAFIVG